MSCAAPGSMSMSAQRGSAGASMPDVHGCSSIAAWFPSQASVARLSAMTYAWGCRSGGSGSRQRVTQSGVPFATSFCQKKSPSIPPG